METKQINKDLIQTLRTLTAQTDKVIEMLKRDEEVVIIYNLFRAAVALILKASEEQFIHILRNDANIKSEVLHLHIKLSEAQSMELDIIDKNLLTALFADYTAVFKQFAKMKVSFE